MPFNKPTRQYWDNKFAAYMHDPFDKAFRIQGHEDRAADLISLFGLAMPNEKFWQKADGIASGFERAQVPSFSADQNKNGAVDFVNGYAALLTHPTSSEGQLKIKLPATNINQIHDELKKAIKTCIGTEPGDGGYSDKFRNEHDDFTLARLLYTHLVLRFKLAEENVAGLGGLWHRIPADTRFPDHSIWQHNALTSALSSCMELSDDEEGAGLMVFSITPVQSFISTARKLRDYWSGSVILSWLAFEGLRWVIENLGPDHVLYPSLIDQSLVNEYLSKDWQIDLPASMSSDRSIASLPNKFLFLIPFKQAKEIADGLQKTIQSAWQELTGKVNHWLKNQFNILSPQETDHLNLMFKDQTQSYWDMQWAAVRLIGGSDQAEIERLLPESAYSNQTALLDIFNKIIADKPHYEKGGKGVLYSVSHQLVQASLAATKMKRKNNRPHQNGEKCQLCGEFEVLHHRAHKDGQAAADYAANIKEFWNQLQPDKENKAADNNQTESKEFKENERLCAVCLTKRMAYRVIKTDRRHILEATFGEAGKFPSTTRMSLHHWFEINQIAEHERNRIADDFHDQDSFTEEKSPSEKVKYKFTNRDKYYAILMMDGDKMGKLINGATIASTWESVMHPEMYGRLQKADFDAKYKKGWDEIFNKYPKRQVTPAIHAAISEALADFSIYGAGEIVKKHAGRMIYAGGDDVCAVLPIDQVWPAADAIQKYYKSKYACYSDGESRIVENEWLVQAGKLSVLLGQGEDISISAGIMICHHKENLTEMIAQTHELLNLAKNSGGRNACALELRKRSGGPRQIVAKWDSPYWQHFVELQQALRKTDAQELSRSLVYRLAKFSDGFMAILKSDQPGKIKAFILSLMDKSEIISHNEEAIAEKIAFLITAEKNQKDTSELKIKTDGLIIAAFLAGKEQ